jgi:hypothetical protein
VIYIYTAWRLTKLLVDIRVTIRWGFSGYVLFSRFQSCVRGYFLIFPNIRFFWLLSVATLKFSAVVVYIVIRSSRRSCFNFRTYCHCHFQWIQQNACSHSPVSFMQWRTCCALFSSCVVFIAFLQWGIKI